MGSPAMRAAAEAILTAIRTGEYSAARRAETYLAEQPRFRWSRGEASGRDAVFERLVGQWALTPVLGGGLWDTDAGDTANQLVIRGRFPGKGAAPEDYRLTIEFDDQEKVAAITESFTFPKPPAASATMPAYVRRCIDHALLDGKPVTVAFARPGGDVSLSLRGSLQTRDGDTLILWLRNAQGGLADAIRAGRTISFLYRDSASRTTLTAEARGTIVEDAAGRRAIFDRTPEVEQRHDPGLSGAAAELRLLRLSGTTPDGPVLVIPPA
ncbi:MAG: hypothetical protein DI569_08415 [Sphingopyxis macrogoltabida]|uniref:Uncharacterized protein n=1 Tax=Sphingopyxis macrogoltabida TaxID=33050 RepID=A0A2W5L6Q4_SPHMC|nr:MAG: hypothetical protein DI569_08415 [Sphingopyxis macrogoltabida]